MAKNDTTENDQTKLKSKLRQQAQTELLERHRPEYNEIAERLFAEHGLEFTRRLTEEEKKEKALREAIEANPDLAAKILGANAVNSRVLGDGTPVGATADDEYPASGYFGTDSVGPNDDYEDDGRIETDQDKMQTERDNGPF